MLGSKVFALACVAFSSAVLAEFTEKNLYEYPSDLTAEEKDGQGTSELAERGFPGCETCRQVWCDIQACYHPENGPGKVTVAAIGSLVSQSRDGATTTEFHDSGSNCANGLRKGTGLVKIWRVSCEYRAGRYNTHYSGPEGTFSSNCRDNLSISVKKC